MGIEYDSSTLMKKMNQMDEDKRKVDEMYKVKHLLFDYIHLRIRTLKKSHKSQKLGKHTYFELDPKHVSNKLKSKIKQM